MKRKNLSAIISVVSAITLFLGASTVSATENTEVGNNEAIEQNVSSPENDTEVGLLNMLVADSSNLLTPEQKSLVGFFDADYLPYTREFFERYSNHFIGAKVFSEIHVKKIVSRDANSISFLATESNLYNSYADLETCIMYVTCPQLDIGIMEGDNISVYGVFKGVETKEFDGQTYNVGCVEATNRTHLAQGEGVLSYDYSTMKQFAKALFGPNIRIDREREESYVVTFENQSSANFSKVYMSALRDLPYGYTPILGEDANGNCYNIALAADFNHFYYLSYNDSTSQAVVAYYDKELNKIWQREFENTENIAYDYTKNNIYLALNNDLYIINTETGQDTYRPVYVGQISDVCKAEDGIYLTRQCADSEITKSDVVMKLDNTGRQMWVADLDSDYNYARQTQILNDTLLLEYSDGIYDNCSVAVIDKEDGIVVQTCKEITKGTNQMSQNSGVAVRGQTNTPDYWTVSVQTGYLALRNAKGYDAANEIGELYTGDVVEVIDASDPEYWYVYSPLHDLYGYVNKDYIY